MSQRVFVKRNEKHEIIAISKIQLSDFPEVSSLDNEEIKAFLLPLASNREFKRMQIDFVQSDFEMIRVLEDLIQLLIDKNIIGLTELPDAAQEKLLQRHKLRSSILDVINPEAEEEGNENIDI